MKITVVSLFILFSLVLVSLPVSSQVIINDTIVSPFIQGLESEIGDDMLRLSLCYQLQGFKTGFLEYYEEQKDDLFACNSFLSGWDSDGDWYGDEEELALHTDPSDHSNHPSGEDILSEEQGVFTCVDDDGICDADYEEACFDLKLSYDSDCIDDDDDGFMNYEESWAGTDKESKDEAPWWIDLDGDGNRNLDELRAGTNPFDNYDFIGWKDSDKDGFTDDFELSSGSDPEDHNDVPIITRFAKSSASAQNTYVEEESLVPEGGYVGIIPEEDISSEIVTSLVASVGSDVASDIDFDISIVIYVISGMIVVVIIVLSVFFFKKRSYDKRTVATIIDQIKHYRSAGYSFDQILNSYYSAGYEPDVVLKAMELYRKNGEN